mmetsp:Transcript_470/g.661  ORF Transcript_470/g.661 Transcript_470/m.661 type:complete len:373 (+) Transcript_470:21-1139(+)
MANNTNTSKRIVICGGGVIGSCTAYFLAKRGVGAQVTIIEQTGIACAASGKAGGFLALDWCDNSPVGPLARLSFSLHKQLSEELGVDYGYRPLDTLSVGMRENNKTKKETDTELPEWLNKDLVTHASTIGNTQNTAQCHPGKLCAALVDAAKQMGVAVKIGTVQSVQHEAGQVKSVTVDGETVPCDVVVMALGPWSAVAIPWFPAKSFPSIKGVKAHSITLRPTEPFTAHAIFLDYRTSTGKSYDPEIYPRKDEVYMCGVSEIGTDLPSDASKVVPSEGACETIYNWAKTVAPSLASLEIDKRQACFLPHAADGLPVIGPVPGVQGAFVATGHTCWGILNGPATGVVVSEMILDGEAKSVDCSPFSVTRFKK